MRKIRHIRKFIINIFSIIKIILKSSPIIVTKLFICNVLLGIVTSLNVYLWKYLVDSATYSLEYGKVGEAFIWLGGIGGCIETINLFNRLSIYYREIAQESMNCYINEMVIEKVNQLDMSYFDDSKIYDTLEKVSSESGARCVSILVMLVSGSIAILLCFILVPIFYVSFSIAY